MRRARVDLPQPDSPTMPRVSPAATARLTSSTARQSVCHRAADSALVEAFDFEQRAHGTGIPARGSSAVREGAERRGRSWRSGRDAADSDRRSCNRCRARPGRDEAGNGGERHAATGVAGRGREQAGGVGMAGTGPAPRRPAPFDDPPGIHDHDLVAQLGDDAEIVGDEQDGQAEVALQRSQQVEDLRLNGDVERGRRFIGDEQLRAADEGHGNHHPLAQAARELVRILLRSDARGCRCRPCAAWR